MISQHLSLFLTLSFQKQKKKCTLVLINFVFGTAKLAIWKTRKIQTMGHNWTDAVLCLKVFVAAQLRIEHAYHVLTCSLEEFRERWQGQWGFMLFRC